MSATTTTNSAKSQVQANASGALPVGMLAPDFALKSTPDQTVRLSEFRGQPVVLFFYPADWSPVCGDQVSLCNEMLAEFQYGAKCYGSSGLLRVLRVQRGVGLLVGLPAPLLLTGSSLAIDS